MEAWKASALAEEPQSAKARDLDSSKAFVVASELCLARLEAVDLRSASALARLRLKAVEVASESALATETAVEWKSARAEA